jgi:uncharacterized coiled-coil DUF342 family protein
MLGGDTISKLLEREDETEEIQSEIREVLRDKHPEPNEARNAIASYRAELNNLEQEIGLLDSSDLIRNHQELFRNAQNLIERTVRIMEDISKITTLIDDWIDVLSPVESGKKPDFQRSHEISSELRQILDNLPESKSGSTKLLNNIEEVEEVIERVFSDAEEAKRELERIESIKNSDLEAEESELQALFEELQQIKTVRKKVEELKQEKERVEEKAEELAEDLESVDELEEKINRISTLLHKTPETIFKFEDIDEDLRMSQLRKAFRVKRRLEILPDVLEEATPDQVTRRQLLKSYGKFYAAYMSLASSGLYSYFTYKNVKKIDKSGGGKEVFFTGGEEKPYQHDNAVEKVIEGEAIPVNIIHVRLKDEQPSYSNDKFERSIKLPFSEDLNIRIEPKFLELDVRNAKIGGSKNFQEQRQMLAKLISKTQVGSGIDQKYFSTSAVKKGVAREIYGRIFAFDKISENMVYGSSESNPTISLVISDFEEGNAAGVAASGISRNLALVQDYRNQQLTEGVAVHELGHKFGLPHASTPQDIMSYSGIRGILERAGRPYFSWESKHNWWKVKNSFERI